MKNHIWKLVKKKDVSQKIKIQSVSIAADRKKYGQADQTRQMRRREGRLIEQASNDGDQLAFKNK